MRILCKENVKGGRAVPLSFLKYPQCRRLGLGVLIGMYMLSKYHNRYNIFSVCMCNPVFDVRLTCLRVLGVERLFSVLRNYP